MVSPAVTQLVRLSSGFFIWLMKFFSSDISVVFFSHLYFYTLLCFIGRCFIDSFRSLNILSIFTINSISKSLMWVTSVWVCRTSVFTHKEFRSFASLYHGTFIVSRCFLSMSLSFYSAREVLEFMYESVRNFLVSW